MAGGQNLLSGKKVIAAPEFICGQTRILAMHLIVKPHQMANGYGPQFSSDSTFGNVYGRVNQHGAVHLDKCFYSMFSNAILRIRTRSTKEGVLVLFN